MKKVLLSLIIAVSSNAYANSDYLDTEYFDKINNTAIYKKISEINNSFQYEKINTENGSVRINIRKDERLYQVNYYSIDLSSIEKCNAELKNNKNQIKQQLYGIEKTNQNNKYIKENDTNVYTIVDTNCLKNNNGFSYNIYIVRKDK